MKLRNIAWLILIWINGCSPTAIFFHESTKVAFAAEYKPDASEPLSTTLGFKRRIVAVVPVQEPSKDRNGANSGEALSLVSRFDITSGDLKEGLTIVNNFASGKAARALTAAEDQTIKVQGVGTQGEATHTNVNATGDPAAKIKNLLKTQLPAPRSD